MRGLLGILACALSLTARAETLLLAVREDQQIRVLATSDLGEIGSFSSPRPVHGVIPAAGSLFLETMPHNDCCTLEKLDFQDLVLVPISEPTLGATLTGEGRYVLTQRGDFGIDIFDARTLGLWTTIGVAGSWSFHARARSPLVLGLDNQRLSAAILDAHEGRVVRSFALEGDQAQAVWHEDSWAILAFDGLRGKLWRLGTDGLELENPTTVDLPGAMAGEILQFRLMSIGGRLFLYELFGYTLDRRDELGAALPGGIVEIDPATGAIVRHLAPELHVIRAVSDPEQKDRLYVLDTDRNRWEVKLNIVDSLSGAILERRPLGSGNWDIAMINIDDARLLHRIRNGSPVRTRSSAQTGTSARH